MNKTLKEFKENLVQIQKELRVYNNPIFNAKDWLAFCRIQDYIEKSVLKLNNLIVGGRNDKK